MRTYNMHHVEISADRWTQLNKMARFLQNSGAATIDERGTWEGGHVQQTILVGGEPIAQLTFTPGKNYYAEHVANYPPGPLTWGDL